MKAKLLLIGLLIWNLNAVFAQVCGTLQPTNPTIYPEKEENFQKKGSENLTIQKTQTTNKLNAKKTSNDSNPAYYKIFDFNSSLIFKGFIDNQTTIDVSSYKRGNYILKIYKNGKSESHQIIVN